MLHQSKASTSRMWQLASVLLLCVGCIMIGHQMHNFSAISHSFDSEKESDSGSDVPAPVPQYPGEQNIAGVMQELTMFGSLPVGVFGLGVGFGAYNMPMCTNREGLMRFATYVMAADEVSEVERNFLVGGATALGLMSVEEVDAMIAKADAAQKDSESTDYADFHEGAMTFLRESDGVLALTKLYRAAAAVSIDGKLSDEEERALKQWGREARNDLSKDDFENLFSAIKGERELRPKFNALFAPLSPLSVAVEQDFLSPTN